MNPLLSASRLLIAFMSILTCQASFAQEVGVAWMGKSSMASAVLAGVQDRLKEIAPTIRLDIHAELGSIDEMDAVVKGFARENKAGQIILRSSGTVYLRDYPPTIPSFIGGNNHPVKLGTLKSMESPQGLVTGVTYFIPIIETIESFMLLHPYMDSILLLSQANYVSSAIDWEGTEQACIEFGFRCEQAMAGSREELKEIILEKGHLFSAIVMGNQSRIFDNTDVIIENNSETPLFSYAAKGVAKGAAGGVIADDHKLGGMLADSLVDVIINGKKVSEVPVKIDDEPVLMVNIEAITRYGLDFPASLLNVAEIIE